MPVLVIGGTAFTGPHVVEDLVRIGADVAVYHRGIHERPLPETVTHIHGDLTDISTGLEPIRRFSPDTVVHMLALTGDDVARVIDAIGSSIERLVVVSSIDVYRAYGRLHRTEPGDYEPTPLQENAALRQNLGPEGPQHDKLAVENVTLSHPGGTIIRYPAVYGPGDRRRMTHYIQRMVDGRPHIVVSDTMAPWRFSRGYSRNVAHGVALVTAAPSLAEKTFNVADRAAYSEREWIEQLADRVGWNGTIVEADLARTPPALRQDLDFHQDWVVDTTRIRTQLGYAEPTPTDEAITTAVHWELEHPPREWPTPDYAEEDALLA